MFVVSGLLFVALSVPLILRRVKPNAWYGFRTPKTMGSEDVWYAANAYSGALLLAVGMVTAAAGIVLALLPLNWAVREMIGLAVMTLSLIWVLVQSFRYLKTL